MTAGTVVTTFFGGLERYVDPAAADRVVAVVRDPSFHVLSVVDEVLPDAAPPPGLLETFFEVRQAATEDGQRSAWATAWESVRMDDQYGAYLDGEGDHADGDAGPAVVDTLADRVLAVDGRVVLLCRERNPAHCHRDVLADRVAAAADGSVSVRHLPPPDAPLADPAALAEASDEPVADDASADDGADETPGTDDTGQSDLGTFAGGGE